MESTAVRFTIPEFVRMGEAGVFDDRERVRIELIEGEIREMMSPNPPHGVYVQRLLAWAFGKIPTNLGTVFSQHSLQLTPVESVVEPDLYVVVPGDYLRRLPNELEAMLVAEVADSSRNRDLGEKASLYSRSGIADYWVVDVANECIHVHRDPDTEGQGGFRSIRVVGKGDSVSPLAFPDISLKVETVFQE
jgi:Uma2 family endonuclease